MDCRLSSPARRMDCLDFRSHRPMPREGCGMFKMDYRRARIDCSMLG